MLLLRSRLSCPKPRLSLHSFCRCVSYAELLLRRAWFPGETDLDQLGKVFQALGTPNQDTWPGCTALPQFVEFQATTAPPLRNTFRQVGFSVRAEGPYLYT